MLENLIGFIQDASGFIWVNILPDLHRLLQLVRGKGPFGGEAGAARVDDGRVQAVGEGAAGWYGLCVVVVLG